MKKYIRLCAIPILLTLGSAGWAFADPWWVDIDRNGFGDYCYTESSELVCIYSDGQGGYRRTALRQRFRDMGYPEGRGWADIDGDGYPDFCRVIGTGHNQGFLCDYNERGQRFPYSASALNDDWGYPETRRWVDHDQDGDDEFCREVGNRSGRSRGTYWLCTGVYVDTNREYRFGAAARLNSPPRAVSRHVTQPSFNVPRVNGRVDVAGTLVGGGVSVPPVPPPSPAPGAGQGLPSLRADCICRNGSQVVAHFLNDPFFANPARARDYIGQTVSIGALGACTYLSVCGNGQHLIATVRVRVERAASNTAAVYKFAFIGSLQ